ncbi:unnamed protein product [Mycena citricolor]|uniref:Uncharacterized protein n=1 Tax=Mycena citricolor TaxID=2018698 RepID=A0AAD2I043_9AGAR|nr:unnamed protein product [Mycena citricolor]
MLQETGRVVEDVWDGELSYNLVSAKELPEPVFYHNTVEGEIPIGAVVATDPYEMYLESIPSNENPRHVYVGDSSAALRTINGRINARLDADCILDSGSQIVSMAFSEAVDAQLSWDPKVVIYMESANGSISKSLGLARNVPFRFGTILVYLQVHILESPAYKVLLGRPFDIATESNIKNAADGSQIITMRDPNLKTRCAMATQPRRADDLPRNTKNNDGSTGPTVRRNRRPVQTNRTLNGIFKELRGIDQVESRRRSRGDCVVGKRWECSVRGSKKAAF